MAGIFPREKRKGRALYQLGHGGEKGATIPNNCPGEDGGGEVKTRLKRGISNRPFKAAWERERQRVCGIFGPKKIGRQVEAIRRTFVSLSLMLPKEMAAQNLFLAK